MLRRLQRQLPKIPILVGLWAQERDGESLDRLKDAVGADHLATTLRQAVEFALTEAQNGERSRPPVDISRPALQMTK